MCEPMCRPIDKRCNGEDGRSVHLEHAPRAGIKHPAEKISGVVDRPLRN